jgi:hypothetical protein
VNEEVKIEDEKMLDGFKDECESRFIQSNDEKNCIDTVSRKSQKRKQKEELMTNDVKVGISTTPNHDQNEMLEKT